MRPANILLHRHACSRRAASPDQTNDRVSAGETAVGLHRIARVSSLITLGAAQAPGHASHGRNSEGHATRAHHPSSPRALAQGDIA